MEEAACSTTAEEGSTAAAGTLCPMFFGSSCAFVALHLLSGSKGPELDSPRRRHLGEVLLLGSAHLLGLLLWRSERGKEVLEETLRAAESEVEELKRLRAEDAKANEKVAGIFASREQCWIAEKKQLKLETQSALSQLRALETHSEEPISGSSNSGMEEKDSLVRSKDEAVEMEIRKREELEEKLRAAEEEFGERARKAAQDHAAELRRHKTAFAELVSNHRQLEAEMGRALRQVGAAREELAVSIQQKEGAVAAAEKLSADVARLQGDAEEKAKVLSALLRKSRLEAAERQALLREVKACKAREKKAELEVEKLRSTREARRPKEGSRTPQAIESDCSRLGRSGLIHGFHHHRTLLSDYLQRESAKNSECVTPEGDEDREEELVTVGIRQLQGWVHSETQKCASLLQQRHYAEVEAFTEQMRLKDERLEAHRWRALSMELESKRLRSHIDELERNLSKYRDESIKLEALLQDREEELVSHKEQFSLHLRHCRQENPDCLATIKRDANEKRQELVGAIQGEESLPVAENLVREGGDWKAMDGEEQTQLEWHDDQGEQGVMVVTSQAPLEETEEEKVVSVDPGHALSQAKNSSVCPEVVNKMHQVSVQSSIGRDTTWKVDLHALGISYKIKRVKQQLLVIEKLAAAHALKQLACGVVDHKPDGCEKTDADGHEQQPKGFLLTISFLNKQVKRYQSLEQKADDLCKRMGNGRGPCVGRKEEQTEGLEGFLGEAFELQRHVVATGQKWVEVQSRLACSVSSGGEGHPPELNTGQFADVVRTLFREIQRGFEVRVARVIGGLEGTLAREGILHI